MPNLSQQIAQTGNCFREPPKVKKGRGRIAPMSKKRQGEAREYSKLRKAFLLAHPGCQAYEKILWGAPVGLTPGKDGWLDNVMLPRSVEIHHVKGRGKYLNDESTWLAVSRLSHDWIHANPSWARKLGLLA